MKLSVAYLTVPVLANHSAASANLGLTIEPHGQVSALPNARPETAHHWSIAEASSILGFVLAGCDQSHHVTLQRSSY